MQASSLCETRYNNVKTLAHMHRDDSEHYVTVQKIIEALYKGRYHHATNPTETLDTTASWLDSKFDIDWNTWL